MLECFYPYEYADSVFSIDYKKLYDQGFRGILFDIDNTLVHHGDDSTPEIDSLFSRIQSTGLKTILISNNDEARVKRFIKNIDTLYICDADKPNTAAYLKAVKMLDIRKKEALVIGDQMFIDILGANKSGLASILVKFIKLESETKIGKRRYLEYLVLEIWKHNKKYRNRLGDIYIEKAEENMPKRKQKKLFCEICPATYAISEAKEKCKRYIQDFLSKEKFAKTKIKKRLPNVVSSYSSELIKKGKGIDPKLQINKAINIKLASSKINGIIIHPGEVFSFWRTVGEGSKREGYRVGRVISGGKLVAGLGGGLCNLANTIHLLILHSPLEVVEFHSHSDALAPDHGERVPFSSGTSVSYNYIDYRFKNNTDQDVQLLVWCRDGKLWAELRSERQFPQYYEIFEEDHHFHKEGNKYYRISKIYRNVIDRATGKVTDKQLIRDNHSEVMFDYDEIPKELIR